MPDNAVFRLYLLRHAQSGWAMPGQKDFDRTLDETGVKQASSIAALALRHGFRPDIIVSSSANRCRQTAETFAAALGDTVQVVTIDDLYSGTADDYRALILSYATSPSLLVVGHNPTIEETLRSIIGEDAALRALADGYPTAAFAVIDIDRKDLAETPLTGTLVEWLLPR